MPESNASLVLRGVTKRFPGVLALDGVDFEAAAGEIHALVGGNGAGKSTLMAVASGALKPDSGAVEIAGRPLTGLSPVAAREHGLAIAFQHPALLPDLTVTENLMLSVPVAKRPRFGDAASWAEEKLRAMGMPIDPAVPVRELNLAQKQAVEICGALACDPDVVIFDEPTEPFMAAETDRLFEHIRELAARGVAVVYISHRLPDVFALADRITVLRDGQVRGTFARSDVTEQEIVTRVAGREVTALFPARAADPGEPVLSVQDLTSERLGGVSVSLARREILGLAGVEGNGQREFIRALGGAAPGRGRVSIEGRPADLSSPRRARAAGVVLMPQERHVEGVATVHSVRENLTVAATGATSRAGVIAAGREDQLVRREVSGLGIKLASPEVAVETLSGGNQQKVVLGRALLSEPKVLLCDEPTQGIDVGVRSDIYHRLRETAEGGVPVVVLSSDNVELAGLCDRVLVFSKGQVVAELAGEEITDDAITTASLTGSVATQEEQATGPHRGRRRFLSGEQGPSLVLLAAILVLLAVGAGQNGRFLSAFNISSMLELAGPLLFLSAGQLIVMLTGGIDLSVGPLCGALVVVGSFYIGDDFAATWWIVGIALMVLVAVGVGLLNGGLVKFARVTPVVATLVTFMGLQGLSLFMRDVPGGPIAEPVTSFLKAKIGPVPWPVLAGVVLLVLLELGSRRSVTGLFLRGTGSDDKAAHKRGIPVSRVYVLAYVASAVCTLLGAFLLAAQTGIGDPTAGTSYTLTSITAVVLGGASIFGGRGSFVGVLFGVLLLQVTQTTASFAGLSQAWQYWLPGIMALAATGLFAQVQRRRRRA
ncbi:ATP-binding cassette domain-containing protein [Amycolatopsis panacis]|uniref:ATP-binding cassette domain-containing protein n=1 Tax=Amycolatopsis panacis TaxID=2340917 RepID=A0A419HL39_9PSEU|nr:ATP-binding cassette domain-containing protein [Amycolatopsis panacis]RJQ76721.1 ATP-binding cassette domain-containing protein [Amycolatopsis panacis]